MPQNPINIRIIYAFFIVKLRHLEMAIKSEKNLPLVLTKQLFLLSSVKTIGRLFQIFLAFSENLDFTKNCSDLSLFEKIVIVISNILKILALQP